MTVGRSEDLEKILFHAIIEARKRGFLENIKSKRKGGVHMNKLSAVDWIAVILLAVGGLNWGLVGAMDFDLVAAIFGDMSALSRVVYAVVGISAIYVLAISAKLRKE